METPIYEKINEYLSSNNIAQAVLVNETGMTKNQISRILNGSQELSAAQFFLFCDALKVNPMVFAPKRF